MFFAQLAALDLLGEGLGYTLSGKLGRRIDAFGIHRVSAPQDAVRRYRLKPFLIRAFRRRIAHDGEPAGIDPDILVSHGDDSRLANPRIPSVEQNEFSFWILLDRVYQEHRIRSLYPR